MPNSAVHLARKNHLLGSLGSAEMLRISPRLELVEMPLGKVLNEAGDTLRHVYFPTDCIVSLLYVLRNGASAEIAIVGNDGLIGIALFMGGETMPNRAVVQSAGYAYRLDGALLKDEFHENPETRLLLLSLDRLPSNQFTMTQELIADMLGVRREGVTAAAGKLQKLGIIRYHRGEITVLDRPALELLCCECYADVKKETDRLLQPRPG